MKVGEKTGGWPGDPGTAPRGNGAYLNSSFFWGERWSQGQCGRSSARDQILSDTADEFGHW